MSYTTITAAVRDPALQDRVSSAIQKEAWNSDTLSETQFGASARRDQRWATDQMMYPVAIDTEAAYEFAINNENPNPGGDASVITDGDILSAVQAHWPQDPEPPPV